MTVPTTGIKFKGKYIKYLIKAVGVNFINGCLTSFPSFAMGLLPALICLPLETRSVVFFETKTPSKVSVRAPSIKKVLLRMVKIVELSLRTRSAALIAARGPLVKAMTAVCGK